jgi:PleD family two-component response regulator
MQEHETVLVVDPNIEFLDRTRQILEEDGYRFLQSMHWEDARLKLEQETIDCLLVNALLDEEGGESLLEYARHTLGLTCGTALMVGQSDPMPDEYVMGRADLLLIRPLRPKELRLALQALAAIRSLLQGGASYAEPVGYNESYLDEPTPVPATPEPPPVPPPVPVQPAEDEDTPLYPMSWFRRLAVLEVKRAIYFGQPLSLLLLSYDMTEDFIAYHSEETLEQLAVALAYAVSQAAREVDLPVQFSRDHILVLLPNTDVIVVLEEASRLKDETTRLLSREFEGSLQPPSLSVGATTSTSDGPFKFTDLLKDATSALREVRSKGGDAVGYR